MIEMYLQWKRNIQNYISFHMSVSWYSSSLS
jgi:hypothetical protein